MSSEQNITATEEISEPIEYVLTVNIVEPFYVTISPSLDFTIKI